VLAGVSDWRGEAGFSAESFFWIRLASWAVGVFLWRDVAFVGGQPRFPMAGTTSSNPRLFGVPTVGWHFPSRIFVILSCSSSRIKRCELVGAAELPFGIHGPGGFARNSAGNSDNEPCKTLRQQMGATERTLQALARAHTEQRDRART